MTGSWMRRDVTAVYHRLFSTESQTQNEDDRNLKASILNIVMRPECFDVRAHVWAAIEVERSPRITDYDLRGYRRPEPGWIMDRICCLAIAAEVRRIIVDCEPAFERVRHVLGTQPAARKLLHECRTHVHPNSQFVSFTQIGLKVLPALRSARLTIMAMGKPGLLEHTTITAPSY